MLATLIDHFEILREIQVVNAHRIFHIERRVGKGDEINDDIGRFHQFFNFCFVTGNVEMRVV